jgi:2-keto-4-pentenoate hydratase/2-oxohepta-3-ene-1,7-dioic acid hydratase in catechol pathway
VTDRARFTEEARTNNGLMAKNHKGLSGIGPCIWLPDARDATPGRATLRLDGRELQSFHLNDLVWTAGEVAAWWSAARLVPGDMIGLGPAILRGGHARIPPVRISGGERIEISCEEVGVLELRIADRSTV